MMVNIYSILESQDKSVHSLSKEIDCDYHNLLNLCSGKTSKISLSLLEKICITLNCTPSDILVVERKTKKSHQ